MIDAAQLIDADVRRRVIETTDRCLCVEAGAGTGKTTLMIARVLHLLRSGFTTVERIVLISFTEKAAAELRSRLRDGLEAAYSDSTNAEERERLDAALVGLDGAHVATIHAFAASILREFPFEAGLPPTLEPLDEIAASLGFDVAWEAWLSHELTGDPPPLRTALEQGLSLDQIRALAERLHHDRALLPMAWPLPDEPDRADLGQTIRADVAHLYTLADACTEPTDLARLGVARIATWASGLDANATLDGALLTAPKLTISKGAKKNWRPADALTQVREVSAVLEARVSEAAATLRGRTLAHLARWAERFVSDYAEERRRDGRPTFDDLLLWTRDLLRDDREVRAVLQQRYDALIVDEFQDTDPLQVEIVAFLAEHGAHAQRWDDVRLSPGKLCIVGDPKQAIYRFRRADIAVYAAATSLVEREGVTEAITQNFRSVEPLLAWVNRAFETLIIEDATAHTQPAYRPIHPVHPAHPGLARPPVALLPALEPESHALARRTEEATSIAALARRIVAEGWPVRDGRDVRAARLSDIALLFPGTAGLEAYEDALTTHGLAYRFEGGRRFYRRQEVRDLTLLVAVVDDPTDAIGVVGALKSSAFAVPDERLLAFSRAGGRFNPLADAAEGFAEIGAAFALLREAYAARTRQSSAATVEWLLARTRLAEAYLPRAGGAQAVANLWKVVEQAAAFDRRADTTFRGFARWLARNAEHTAREVESPSADDDASVLRMFTVHGCKGLEFPVVILANLAAGSRSRERWFPDRQSGQIEFCLGDANSPWRTAGYAAAQEREAAHIAAERVRLLYVACTSARDHLVIPIGAGGSGSMQSLLAQVCPPLDELIGGTTHGDQYIVDVASLPEADDAPRAVSLRFDGDPTAGLAARAACRSRVHRSLV